MIDSVDMNYPVDSANPGLEHEDRALQVLVIEDNQADFLLLQRHLRQLQIPPYSERVDTTADLSAAMKRNWDIVLSDFNVPGMEIKQSLQIIQQCQPELPVILVSGSIGEDLAVELLHLGFSDFILKDRLARLPNAIRRTIAESDERRARRIAETQLLKLASAVEQSPESIMITDTASRIEYVNRAFEITTGYPAEEAMGQNPNILNRGDTPRETYRALWRTLLQGKVWHGEFHNTRRDGSKYLESATIAPIRNPDATITHYVAVKQDITAKRRSEALIHRLAYYDALTGLPNRARFHGQLASKLDDNARQGEFGALMVLDIERFQFINDTLGYEAGDQMLREFGRRLQEVTTGEDVVARIGGDEFAVLLFGLGSDAESAQALASAAAQRLTERINAPYRIDAGNVDADGNNANRTTASSTKTASAKAVSINTDSITAGGTAADSIAADSTTADSTTAASIETDNIETDRIKTDRTGEGSANVVRRSFSIGICLFSQQEKNVDAVLNRAEVALRTAKAERQDTIRFFTPSMQAAVDYRAELETGLRLALENGDFALYLQPQFDRDNKRVGAEALIRWFRPGGRMISPADFIPLAEDTGLIVPIGRWVIIEACRLLQQWQSNEATRHLTLAINVSARQFHQPDFVTALAQDIAASGIDTTKLKLELTETVILADLDYSLQRMNEVRKLGVALALDDFGVGYSSMSYLKHLPFDQLKVDQSFVRDMLNDSRSGAIVIAILALGHALGMEVVAEGVETPEHHAFLHKNGCSFYQGYLFSKPIPISEWTTQ